jgi:hypothetical protein
MLRVQCSATEVYAIQKIARGHSLRWGIQFLLSLKRRAAVPLKARARREETSLDTIKAIYFITFRFLEPQISCIKLLLIISILRCNNALRALRPGINDLHYLHSTHTHTHFNTSRRVTSTNDAPVQARIELEVAGAATPSSQLQVGNQSSLRRCRSVVSCPLRQTMVSSGGPLTGGAKPAGNEVPGRVSSTDDSDRNRTRNPSHDLSGRIYH